MSSPPPSRSPGQPGTVLIVTVTRPEGRAVLNAFDALTGHKAQPLRGQKRIYQDLGQVQGARVVLALSEVGSGGLGGSQQSVRLAVEDLQPDAVIMVGIAFGIDPARQQIGQVLVSEQIVAYELQRKGEQDTVLWGDKAHASPHLINWLKHADLTLKDAPPIQFGAILSGEKLIDNLAWREELQKLAPAAIGGEMEGAGLYVACQSAKTDWILVKAICDWADGNKDQNKAEQQALAAKNAAELIVRALQRMPLFGDAPTQPPPDLPSAIPVGEHLANLLAFCDRQEIILNLSTLLEKPQRAPLHLFCFADHVANRPQKLYERIHTDLREKLPGLRLQQFDAKASYGLEDKNGIGPVTRFGQAMLEACHVQSEAELCQQFRNSGADALLLWQGEDCSDWSQEQITRFWQVARQWLDSVAKAGQVPIPIILVLVLRYREGPTGWLARFWRRDVKQTLRHAYQQLRHTHSSPVQLTFQELLILPDYSHEDFRKWLNLERVRDYLGGNLVKFEDEDLLAEHFAQGSSRYNALLKFLQHHHTGTQP